MILSLVRRLRTQNRILFSVHETQLRLNSKTVGLWGSGCGSRRNSSTGSTGIRVTYISPDGERKTVIGQEGENALYLAHRHGVEMEGACEASLACTTCHVYVDGPSLDCLPPATPEEEDLLDLAPFLKENSRLGCQIILNKSLDGMELTLPRATRNFYVDGHKPKPH